MKSRLLNLFLVYSLIITSCSSRLKKPTNAYLKANPPAPVKIAGLTAIPKYSTHIGSLINTGNDTLGFSVFSTYVYFPFGFIKTVPNPNLGILRNFHISNTIIKTYIGEIDIQKLKYGSNKLIFCYNIVNGGKHSDLLKGEIYDKEVKFINEIKIGMNIDAFYKCFFDYFPIELESKYKFFVLESFDLVRHTYSFEDNKLKSVKFSTHRAFDTDY